MIDPVRPHYYFARVFARFALLPLLLFAGVAFPLSAATYCVATTGDDTNPGSPAAPWRTIQKAADSLGPGDTALVRGGVYTEAVTVHVSGSAAGGWVTFKNYPGETPIVDGAALQVPSGDTGLFLIVDRSYVAIEGFEIRNYQANSDSRVPAGVFITGGAHDLALVSNRVHDIVNTNKNGNAFGVAVYGSSAGRPISNLVARGNEVFNLQTGNSESFTLNGNVINFEISGNSVHDNNNIGIVFIGFEGTCPDPARDRARDGVCRSNVVCNISDSRNPSYKPGDNSADGIYCDGCSNVLIELNEVHHSDIGVELASEHANGTADHVTLRDNFIWSNRTEGVSIGGYDAKRGRTLNCAIISNTLYHNDTLRGGSGELYIQYHTASNTITHNTLAANSQNLLIDSPFPGSDNLVDWNLYTAPGGSNRAQWVWQGKTHTGFAAWRAGTTNDAHSTVADPASAAARAIFDRRGSPPP
jgi:hypothetical protein